MNTLASFARLFATSSRHNGVRRAALVLHALQEADREWLLDGLEESQRVLLQGLLDELCQLGLPADPALVDEAIRDTSIHSAGSGRPRPAGSNLEHADARTLARLLAPEPPVLVARLLRLRAWSWADTLLSHLGSAQRIAVQEHLAVGAPVRGASARLDQQLVAHLQKRVEEFAPPSDAPAVHSTLSEPSRAGGVWSRFRRSRPT